MLEARLANFIVTVDEDEPRRRRFMARVRPMIPPVDGLRIGELEHGPFAACWGALPEAPVRSHTDTEVATLLWGEALHAPGSPIRAEDLVSLWSASRPTPPAFDGFHAAVRYHVRDGLTVGGDVLGLFPLYCGVRRGVVLVGSSPELFRQHPLFPVELDAEGLVGLLLTHAPFDGRTLLEGVSRLGPGRALVWSADVGPREVLQYSPAARPGTTGSELSEQVAAFDDAFDRTLRRHAPPGRPYGLLLSGGRDSRMLGGYLRRQGASAVALTLGNRDDYEMRCATSVATELGLDHETHAIQQTTFEQCAELQATWEHLAHGFSSLHMWDAIEPLRLLPSRTLNGYVREFREDDVLPRELQALLERMNRAIAPETLTGLLCFPGSTELVRSTLTCIREAYEEISDVAEERPWRFRLVHLARTHSGGVAWRLTFGSWPVMPILDRELIDLLASLPAASLARRRLQDELLRTHFPRLAALPLDRNSPDPEPILPSWRYRAARRVRGLTSRVHPRLRRGTHRERRYYHRLYDFNGPGWKAVRRRAEPHRERLFDLFEPEALARYLPPPDVDVSFRRPIDDGFGRKLLVGLMLWARDHLS